MERLGAKGNEENTVTECTKPGGFLLRHVVSPIAMTEKLLIVKILDKSTSAPGDELESTGTRVEDRPESHANNASRTCALGAPLCEHAA